MTDVHERLDELESRLDEQRERIEDQREVIEAQRAYIEEMEGEHTVDEREANAPPTGEDGTDRPDDSDGPRVDRRGAMKAGGLLALAGLGVGTAGANPTGQIGTNGRPLRSLYTQEIQGVPAGNSPLAVRTDNRRTLELGVPDTDSNNNTAGGNIVAGSPQNAIRGQAVGAVIAGGGNDETDGGGNNVGNNVVFDDYGTIGGGRSNRAGSSDSTIDAVGATVAGGLGNGAVGEESVVGGGSGNVAVGEYATIAGGANNEARALGATVGGGGGVSDPNANRALGDYSTVAGGRSNDGFDDYATVAGGRNNTVRASYGTIAGGGPRDPNNPDATSNAVYDDYGTVGGGGNNQAGGDDGDSTTAQYATVAGGNDNTASGEGATVGGGDGNSASADDTTVSGGSNNTASGNRATVGGGVNNTATNSSATVGGGFTNAADDQWTTVGGGDNNKATLTYATVAGGKSNKAEATDATVAGGNNNRVSGDHGTVAGGAPSDLNNPDTTRNAVYDNYGTIGGGGNNQAGSDDGTANAQYATVPGGRNNTASGAYSTALGRNATASNDGAFVVGDSTSTEVTSQNPDEARFQPRVNCANGLDVNAVDLGVSTSASIFVRDNALTVEDRLIFNVNEDQDTAGASVTQSGDVNAQGSIRAAGRVTASGDSNNLAGDFGGDVDILGTVNVAETGGTNADILTVPEDTQAGLEPRLLLEVNPGSGNGDVAITETGDINATGNKNFVETVATDDGRKEVTYTSSEADQPLTETVGVARLENGRAELELPDHFGWVTSEDEPLHVQTTPYEPETSGLAVVERSTDRIVVEDIDGEGDYEFSYTVKGTRDGYEDEQVVSEPTATEPSSAPADD